MTLRVRSAALLALQSDIYRALPPIARALARAEAPFVDGAQTLEVVQVYESTLWAPRRPLLVTSVAPSVEPFGERPLVHRVDEAVRLVADGEVEIAGFPCAPVPVLR